MRRFPSFEAAGYWPLRFRVGRLRGVTVWGSGPSRGEDRLLARDGRVVLFRSVASLVRSIRAGEAAERFVPRLDPAAFRSFSPRLWRAAADDARYDYARAGAVLARLAADPAYRAADVVVNHVNMAWDFAETLSDRPMLDLLHRDGGLLDLASALTPYCVSIWLEERDPAALAQFDRVALRRDFATVVRRMERRVVVVS